MEKTDAIEGMVLSIIQENIDPTKTIKVNKEYGLSQAGIDSLQIVKIIVDIESYYGFEFEDDMLSRDQFSSIAELIKYVQQKVQSQ